MAPEYASPQANPKKTATAADRRAWMRSESSRPIPRRIYLVDTFQPLDAWIVDLSQGGLSILVPRPLLAEALLFIELESAPDVEPVKVWASVVRCAPGDDANWLVGCEFVNRLSDDDMTAILG